MGVEVFAHCELVIPSALRRVGFAGRVGGRPAERWALGRPGGDQRGPSALPGPLSPATCWRTSWPTCTTSGNQASARPRGPWPDSKPISDTGGIVAIDSGEWTTPYLTTPPAS